MMKQDKKLRLSLNMNKSQNQSFYDRIIINHKNGYLVAWNIFVSVVTLLSAFSNLHTAAFSTHHDQKLNDLFDDSLIFFQISQEFLFGVDIIVVFLTEYKDPKTGDYSRKLTAIAFNYLKSTFIIDFLAFFPFFETIRHHMIPEYHEPTEYYNFWQLLFLLRLLRLYKAAQLMQP